MAEQINILQVRKQQLHLSCFQLNDSIVVW